MDLTKQIKSRILLSSVVKEVVELRGRSPNFLGLCPFHKEKTPSFYVRDNLGRYKCFGCGEGGDVFQFLMRLKGLSFNEIKEQLAFKAGLKSPKKDIFISNNVNNILYVQSVAHKYFIKALKEDKGKIALNYLQAKRGLSEAMITEAQLGFGGSTFGLINALKAKNISDELAITAGVLKFNDKLLENNFKNRIIFPIRDIAGKVLAFAGRILPNFNAPKYINSHSSELFSKRSNFYGLFESYRSINQGRIPVLVEGYFDAMAFWAIGVPALALCGTSLSKEHIDILSRLSSKLYLCFDNDQAGLLALKNALLELVAKNITSKVIHLSCKDPGDYLKEGKLEDLKSLLSSSVDSISFLINKGAIIGLSNIAERMRFIDELIPIFVSIKRPLLRRQYIQYLAKYMHEDSQILWNEVEKKICAKKYPKKLLAAEKNKTCLIEHKFLLEILLAAPNLGDEIISILPDSENVIKSIFNILVTKVLTEGIKNKQDIEYILLKEKPDDALIIKSLFMDLIALTNQEAQKALVDFKIRAKNMALKTYIGKKRIEIAQYDQKKDYKSGIATLMEQHNIISKANDDKKKIISKALVDKEKNDSKRDQLYDNSMIFDSSEDWL